MMNLMIEISSHEQTEETDLTFLTQTEPTRCEIVVGKFFDPTDLLNAELDQFFKSGLAVHPVRVTG